jgi:hypothetical protein
MPTKERKARERALAKEEQRLDELFANAPKISSELMKNSNNVTADICAGIEEAQSTYSELKLRRGLLLGDELGRVIVNTNAMKRGAIKSNNDRQDVSRDQAEDLRRRYSDIWGKRGAAGKIAAEHGLSPRTVQKYFKKFPKQNERQ